jgi:hypothetical protein
MQRNWMHKPSSLGLRPTTDRLGRTAGNESFNNKEKNRNRTRILLTYEECMCDNIIVKILTVHLVYIENVPEFRTSNGRTGSYCKSLHSSGTPF